MIRKYNHMSVRLDAFMQCCLLPVQTKLGVAASRSNQQVNDYLQCLPAIYIPLGGGGGKGERGGEKGERGGGGVNKGASRSLLRLLSLLVFFKGQCQPAEEEEANEEEDLVAKKLPSTVAIQAVVLQHILTKQLHLKAIQCITSHLCECTTALTPSTVLQTRKPSGITHRAAKHY